MFAFDEAVSEFQGVFSMYSSIGHVFAEMFE
jgi:hypothetical protein